MKRTLLILIPLLLIGGGIYYFVAGRKPAAPQYRLAEVTRGDVTSTVSSTGTLSAVSVVNVGTQVSGTIDQLYVDFNSHVKQGQLLARLDPKLLQAQLDDARAGLEKARAGYAQALDTYNRYKPLNQKGYISNQEFIGYESNLTAAKASLSSAQAAVDRAVTNLGYAEIRSPIDGTVIQRSVDVGQTVAASFSTPTLFVIAQSLDKMEIQANVDEADIGQVKVGQPVTFTVQAHPDQAFKGVVQEIRLQPQTIQNVVNYTVIVTADNDQGLLLPGMTATLDFQVAKDYNVLVVPNAALRFQPSAEALAELQKKMGTDTSRRGSRRGGQSAGGTDSGSGAARSGGGGGYGGFGGGAGAQGAGGATTGTGARTGGMGGAGRAGRMLGQLPSGMGRIWYLDSTSSLRMMIVHTGLSDGQITEVSSPRLHEGMQVIIGAAEATGSRTTNGGSAPAGGNRGGGMGGPRLF